MGNAEPMTVKVYPMCSFQTPNVLLPYTLSDPLRVAPMGTPPILCRFKAPLKCHQFSPVPIISIFQATISKRFPTAEPNSRSIITVGQSPLFANPHPFLIFACYMVQTQHHCSRMQSFSRNLNHMSQVLYLHPDQIGAQQAIEHFATSPVMIMVALEACTFCLFAIMAHRPSLQLAGLSLLDNPEQKRNTITCLNLRSRQCKRMRQQLKWMLSLRLHPPHRKAP